MRVALLQLDIRCDDKAANYHRAAELAGQAADAGCELAILPEVFDTGFSPRVAATARNGGKTVEFLSALARRHGLALVAGMAEPAADDSRCRNVAVALDRNGDVLARYNKIHPFSFTGEDRYFIPGDRPVTCRIAGIPTALFVCYDLRFPEIFRAVARDVEMMIVAANWPTSRREHWETLLKARAIENQCVVIGVNRTGTGAQGLEFPGASRIYGPFGAEIPTRAVNPELLVGDIDIADVSRIREQFPFLQDMRALPAEQSISEVMTHSCYAPTPHAESCGAVRLSENHLGEGKHLIRMIQAGLSQHEQDQEKVQG